MYGASLNRSPVWSVWIVERELGIYSNRPHRVKTFKCIWLNVCVNLNVSKASVHCQNCILQLAETICSELIFLFLLLVVCIAMCFLTTGRYSAKPGKKHRSWAVQMGIQSKYKSSIQVVESSFVSPSILCRLCKLVRFEIERSHISKYIFLVGRYYFPSEMVCLWWKCWTIRLFLSLFIYNKTEIKTICSKLDVRK